MDNFERRLPTGMECDFFDIHAFLWRAVKTELVPEPRFFMVSILLRRPALMFCRDGRLGAEAEREDEIRRRKEGLRAVGS